MIVAASLTQDANDKRHLRPLLGQIGTQLSALPEKVSADSGFFSADNLTDPALEAVELHVPPEKRARSCAVADTMREKLGSEEGRAVYARRKAVAEPVFGRSRRCAACAASRYAAASWTARNGSSSAQRTTS